VDFLELGVASAALLAGLAVVVAVVRTARRDRRAATPGAKTVWGLTLPERGKPGSITAEDTAELQRRAAITADDTWLSHEQAQLVLNSLRFGEAVWQDRCGQGGALPPEAGKAVLEVVLKHEAYQQDLEAAAPSHGQGIEALPDTPCTRQLALTLKGLLAEARGLMPEAGPSRSTA